MLCAILDRELRIEQLPKQQQKSFLNMYHSGYSLAQIADAVEMTETEVLDIITSASA